MADYLTTDTELTSVANAIRTKGGTSSALVYPNGFVSAIEEISTGTDVSDTTAVAGDVRTGKYFYTSAGVKTQGTIADQAAQTITPTTSDQTIASGKYLTGTQTIKGDANLVAGNIKNGITIFGVTGTYEGGGGTPTLIHFRVSTWFHVAESGMTWAEWVESDYAPDSSLYGGDGIYSINSSDRVQPSLLSGIVKYGSTFVISSDIIISNGAYTTGSPK